MENVKIFFGKLFFRRRLLDDEVNQLVFDQNNLHDLSALSNARDLFILERLSNDHILIAVFGGAMVYYGLLIMNMTKLSTLPATKMPSSVLYVILPLSGLLVLINAILVAANQDKKIFDETGDAGKEAHDA